MHAAFHEYLANTAVGGLVLAYGLGLVAVSQTRGDRAMAVAWISSSILAIGAPHMVDHVDPDHITVAERLAAVPVAAVFLGVWGYLRHLIRTSNGTAQARRLMTIAVNGGAGIAVATAVLAAIRPEPSLNDFALSINGFDVPSGVDFWQFGAPLLIASCGYGIAWITLARQDIDPGERTRAIAHAVAILPLLSALVVANPASVIAYAAASAISIYGVMDHLTVQGERAAFLSRFLSPQVAELVRLRGLGAVAKPQELELSVVCVDFRGFTAYTEAVPSQAVIDLISDYHEAVAGAVAEYDGMVKDYAGDGIIILVGAPIARDDHASAAVALARRALVAAQRVTDRWATGAHPLGVGIGVASGRVTVGAIGDSARMDYTAVGTAVNLAARLCAAAEDGTILLDKRAASSDPASCEPHGELSLKGISTPLQVFRCHPPVEQTM